MKTIKSCELNGSVLAYLGDAVIELIAREAALKSGITEVGRLNAAVADVVRATAQSAAVGRIEMLLTEEEKAVYRRGRNTHGMTVPKSASVREYRRASGLEALFAHLYLSGNPERMSELYKIAFNAGTGDADEKN